MATRSKVDEAHLPAEQDRAETPPRLPRAHGHHGRPKGAGAPPRPWPQEAVSLTHTEDAGSPARLERLRKREDFLRAARGVRRVTAGLSLEVCGTPGASGEPVRVGFTASRKVGTAVERNRARRRLKEAAKAVLPLYGLAGNDYVLVARRETLTRPFAGLLEDLKSALFAAHERLGRSRAGVNR